jgi:hypothetical protein
MLPLVKLVALQAPSLGGLINQCGLFNSVHFSVYFLCGFFSDVLRVKQMLKSQFPPNVKPKLLEKTEIRFILHVA